jgi:hypothetical protein
MKELIGKRVFLLPTGNAARGKDASKASEREVIKATKKFITVDIGYGDGDRYRIHDNQPSDMYTVLKSDGDYNSGAMMFLSDIDVISYKESGRIARELSNKFRWDDDWRNLGYDKLVKIAEIVGL